MNKAKVPWGWFQKNYGLFQWLRGNGESVPILHLHPEHAQSAGHRQLLRAIECHTLPAVSFVQPDPGHNMHPGSGSVAVAGAWLDNFIEQVMNSSAWPDIAIVVIWDEGGGWHDHVAPPAIDSQGLGVRAPMMLFPRTAKRATSPACRWNTWPS
jgi:phospholipase C